MSINKELVADLRKAQERIEELEHQIAEATELADNAIFAAKQMEAENKTLKWKLKDSEGRCAARERVVNDRNATIAEVRRIASASPQDKAILALLEE